jgi:hypothetical protein
MKNDNILYVNGCSYAYGQGVHELESLCIEQRFSRTLSDHLGFVEVNKALPGSCNSRIARRTLVDLIQYKPKLAVIVWSDPSRREFKNGPLYHNEPTKYPYDLNQFRVNSKNCSREVTMYYEKLNTVQQDLLDTLYHMLSVKILADSMNIPCIQFHFRENFVNDLKDCLKYNHIHYKSTLFEYINILASDDLVYGLRPNEMFSFEKIGGGYIDHTGHPNKTSHDNVVKWLIKLIESRGIV